jgi:hypothetical protein
VIKNGKPLSILFIIARPSRRYERGIVMVLTTAQKDCTWEIADGLSEPRTNETNVIVCFLAR